MTDTPIGQSDAGNHTPSPVLPTNGPVSVSGTGPLPSEVYFQRQTGEAKQLRTPLKAIVAKCKDCSAYDRAARLHCPIQSCALWPFRRGRNPFAAGRKLSPEQRRAAVERLQAARERR